MYVNKLMGDKAASSSITMIDVSADEPSSRMELNELSNAVIADDNRSMRSKVCSI